jgi:hypothetical protein
MFRYSSRFWLYAPIATFLLIAAGVMAHWWTVTGAFEKKLAALKGHEAVLGITLDWSSVTFGGFPFRVDADFTNFSAHGTGAHGPFSWTTAKFALHALTYGRAKTVFEAAGHQQVRWTDSAGHSHAAAFLPGSLRASSISDGRGVARFDLDIVDAVGADFTAARLQFHMRRDPDGRDLDLMLRADTLKMQGAALKQVQAYATLNHVAAFAGLLGETQAWPDAAKAWRAQGGTAKLSQAVAPALAVPALSSFY